MGLTEDSLSRSSERGRFSMPGFFCRARLSPRPVRCHAYDLAHIVIVTGVVRLSLDLHMRGIGWGWCTELN
eukprot:scaffold86249_cov66-Phaeocystis_antarctica.AAC.1